MDIFAEYKLLCGVSCTCSLMKLVQCMMCCTYDNKTKEMKMKKVIIALAAVACATAVQAASFNWTSAGSNSSKTLYAVDGITTLYASAGAATLYLFDAAIVSQANLLVGLRNGSSIADFTSVTSQSLADSSKITAQTFTYGSADVGYNFYMAVVDGDNVFISEFKSVYGQASDVANVSFSGLKNATSNNLGDAAYSAAGWYTVPEPTSGLLLLVGLAGLALRRRV